MKHLINDIRISDTPELIQYLQTRNTSDRFGLSHRFRFLAERYALKLRSMDFTVKAGDVYFIGLTPRLRHGAIQAEREGLPCHAFFCGLDVEIFDSLEAKAKDQFVADAIHRVLISICKQEGLDGTKVDIVRDLLEKAGDRLEIVRLAKSENDFHFEVVFTVEQLPKLLLSVMAKNHEPPRHLLLAQLDEFNDVFNLAARLTISKSHVRIYPRQSAVGKSLFKRYKEKFAAQGFLAVKENCIEVPIAQVCIDESA